jgi:hypothetical protein
MVPKTLISFDYSLGDRKKLGEKNGEKSNVIGIVLVVIGMGAIPCSVMSGIM